MPQNLFPSGKLYFSEIQGEIQNSEFSFYGPVEWKTKEPVFSIENFKFENPDLILSVHGDISLLKNDMFTKVEGAILFKDLRCSKLLSSKYSRT